ncbi:MAG: hypothetical protein ACE5H9_04720 [Anaerolineae bacterium]
MKLDRPALRTYIEKSFAAERARLGDEGVARLLDAGRAWNLAPTLAAGGTVVFPHAHLEACGHQIAAAVHACLDSGAGRVLVIGVLHALSDELEAARVRVADGADVTQESLWGIQGPGLGGLEDWRYEFSLSNFLFLWQEETRQRGISGPDLILRYPYLAGGRPEILPGIDELQEIAREAVVVTTADPFHHGLGYGEPPETALAPEAGGLDLARRRIEEGLAILGGGDYWGYNRHCVEAKSDARDAGQVTRYLLGPLEGRILDLTWCDTTEMYNQPPPTWVATALIEMQPVAQAG